MSLLDWPEPLGSAGYFGGMGLILLLAGLVVLTAYLRRTAPASARGDEAEESA